MALTKALRIDPNLIVARSHLKEHPEDINQPDELGDTPLHIASIKGQLLLVRFLVSAKADVLATNHVGSTVLHKAVTGGSKGVVDFLLEKEAPWVANNSGFTPFYYARDIVRDKAVLEKFFKLEGTIESELMVNAADIPFIVGKEGRGLERLRVEAQTIVEVPSRREAGDSQTRVLQLTARSQEDIDLVKKLIEERIKEKESRDQESNNASTNTTTVDLPVQEQAEKNQKKPVKPERKENDWESIQYSKQIDIPKNNHKKLIGKEAKTLKQLQERTGTTIIVPPPFDPSETIIVRGEPREVDSAIKEIKGMFRGPDSNLLERKLPVPKDRHRVVIGGKGKNLERIKRMFSVQVTVPPPDSPDEIITLRGTLGDIERAKADIINTLQDTSNRGGGGNTRDRFSGAPGSYGPPIPGGISEDAGDDWGEQGGRRGGGRSGRGGGRREGEWEGEGGGRRGGRSGRGSGGGYEVRDEQQYRPSGGRGGGRREAEGEGEGDRGGRGGGRGRGRGRGRDTTTQPEQSAKPQPPPSYKIDIKDETQWPSI